MLKALSIIAFFCWVHAAKGQSVFASSGRSATVGTLNLSWTMGEPITFTGLTSTRMLTNGFHQSKPNTSTARLGETALAVSIFPNPVQDKLTVTNHPDRSYHITITHVSGKLVKSLTATGSVEVDMSELASGVYTVSLTDQLTSNSFQIVKIK